MNILKVLAVCVLSFVCAISLRLTLHKVAPSLYERIWPAAVAPSPQVSIPVQVRERESAPVAISRSGSSDVHPTGYIVKGARVLVQMSDGTTRTDRDTEMTAVERNSVTLEGRKIFTKPRGSGGTPDRAEPVAREQDKSSPSSS